MPLTAPATVFKHLQAFWRSAVVVAEPTSLLIPGQQPPAGTPPRWRYPRHGASPAWIWGQVRAASVIKGAATTMHMKRAQTTLRIAMAIVVVFLSLGVLWSIELMLVSDVWGAECGVFIGKNSSGRLCFSVSRTNGTDCRRLVSMPSKTHAEDDRDSMCMHCYKRQSQLIERCVGLSKNPIVHFIYLQKRRKNCKVNKVYPHNYFKYHIFFFLIWFDPSFWSNF